MVVVAVVAVLEWVDKCGEVGIYRGGWMSLKKWGSRWILMFLIFLCELNMSSFLYKAKVGPTSNKFLVFYNTTQVTKY